jgi:hypothetical protein
MFSLLPVLLVGGALLVLAGAVLAAACGGDEPPAPAETVTVTATPSAVVEPSASPAEPDASTTAFAVYFLRGEKLGVAERRVPQTRGVARAAMEALCAGPSSTERAAGLGTAVPGGTQLLGVSVATGVATVDLSDRFTAGGGSLSMTARVAQVVYTLTQFPTVRSVRFRVEGEDVATLGGEGVMLDDAQRRADWRDFEPPIFVESPGVGALLEEPFVLRGTARVFEATFTALLTDAGGRRIVRLTVMASEGAPGRGRFRETVAYSTSAPAGMLTVFETSMEDGSRMNTVRIPVRFAP